MNVLGLDIGTESVKLVQLGEGKAGKYELLALGSALLGTNIMASEAEADLDNLAQIIKKLCLDCRVNTKNVNTALPQDKVYTSVITLPKLSEDELSSALRWEAEQYVPFPIDEVTLAHQILGATVDQGKEKLSVLLVAAPNRLVDKTVKVIQKAGLNPVSLETEMISLARSLVPETIKSALVVDMGASATDIAIVRSGQVVLTRSIPTGGTALTRAVSYELGLEENQAEAYKKAYGLDKTKLEGKVVAALSPVLEVVLKEMEKTLEFFMSDKEGGQIGQIVLSGGSALLVEVTNRITEKMNVEVIVGNPFRDVTMKDATKTIPAESYPFYAVACGLAMKETS